MEARIMVVVSLIVTLLYGSFVFFTYVSVHSDYKPVDQQSTNQSDLVTIIQPTGTKEVIEIVIDGKDGSSITINNSSSYFYQLCLNYCDGKESVKLNNEVIDCVCPN